MPTFFERRQLVTPGDLLAEGDYVAGENTYKEDSRVYATRIGLVDYEDKKVSVVALRAFYIPRVGDTVIGTVVEVGFSGWTVDINSPYLALLKASDVLSRPFKPQKNDLTEVLDVGDLVVAKIVSYDRTHNPQLSVNEPGLGKITRGQIVRVTPTKIPRVIGKKGSMISMIKQETECHIILGHNGVILITGKSIEDEELAMMAIHKIEEESHTTGLTDRISQLIKKEKEKGR
ncbi:MAG: exosome complex RNA-binding protein Rrp4 [Candidatus Bathyarchaeota archaeon]|jgi:exosome complex component RRP4|nr:RNA-binding protein [Candidatus Bathyarchaeota archaeon A05DMB-3]MDH7607164.1 exosome complex RNA-binding protein Rrp4 [Candidatus Bathyarchaeota archaeon]